MIDDMTLVSHREHGCGLGPGCGQRYQLNLEDGRWLKVEG